MWFRFDTQTKDFIETIKNARPFTYKRLIPGDEPYIDELQAGIDAFTHSKEVRENEYGLYDVTVIKPPLEYGEEHISKPDEDYDALTVTYKKKLIANLAAKEQSRREEQKRLIDEAAERVRLHFVPHALQAEEYKRTEKLVNKWVADGSNTGDVPQSLQSWMDASGEDVLTAAETITNNATKLNGLLDLIRDIRLKGKKSVTDAPGQDIETTGQGVIEQLNALMN